MIHRLSEPFEYSEIEWRPAQWGLKNGNIWGKVLAYVTNRAIMNRLDEVFGTMGWLITKEMMKYHFQPEPDIVLDCL